MPVTRLNHAVLYVRDAERAAAFYQDVLGMEVVTTMPGAVFLRAAGTANHHDLGLFSLGPQAPLPQAGRVGLYHLAWEVSTIEALAIMADTLRQAGALVGASDHGTSKSLYAKDPDGNEFEVMWAVPRAAWEAGEEHGGRIAALDLDAELSRWGQTRT